LTVGEDTGLIKGTIPLYHLRTSLMMDGLHGGAVDIFVVGSIAEHFI
jgi:hypothetical protein